jgi:hypothetical protein
MDVSHPTVVRGIGALEQAGRLGAIEELAHGARNEPKRV